MKIFFKGVWLIPFLIFGALSLSAIRDKSLSIDEHIHLAAGYSYWKSAQVRLNPEHPPLFKWLAAWPFARSIDINPKILPGWQEGDQGLFSDALLYGSNLNIDPLVFKSRAVSSLFGFLSLALVGILSFQMWGRLGAFLSMVLFALCPNFLAHAPLVNSDVACSFGFLFFSLGAVLFLKKPGFFQALVFSLAFGLALSLKFSAVVLLPIYCFFIIFGLRKKFLHLHAQDLILVGILLGLPYLIVGTFYGSPWDISDYIFGLSRVYANHEKNYPYFMNGVFRSEGFFFYYPFALLVKTPIASLGTFFFSLFFLRKREGLVLSAVIIPAFALLIAGAVARHNIGVRHVLPVLAVMYVLAGGVVQALTPRLSALLVAVVFVLAGVENKKIFPDYLAFFNAAFGGAKKGHLYLDDSNLDWGMDLKRLPGALASLGIHLNSEVGLDYFGRENPAYRKINSHPLSVFDRYFPYGDRVISIHWLQRAQLIPVVTDYAYDWLCRYQAKAILGHTLYVYRFRLGEKTQVIDGIQWQSKEEWLTSGTKRLQDMVAQNPKFYHGHIALAQAYYLGGRLKESDLALEKARALNPADATEPQRLLNQFKLRQFN